MSISFRQTVIVIFQYLKKRAKGVGSERERERERENNLGQEVVGFVSPCFLQKVLLLSLIYDSTPHSLRIFFLFLTSEQTEILITEKGFSFKARV